MKSVMSLRIVVLVLSVCGYCVGMSNEEILNGADERIKLHRMGGAMLILRGPDGKYIEQGTEVKIEQVRHEFLFGCNIFKLGRCRTEADNAAYEKYFSELMNFATLGFYWWNYSNEHGRMNDDSTREIVKWCREHNITTKGHPLAWNYVDPKWLPDGIDESIERQFWRIGRCARTFDGDIDIWDVVNEATHYDRKQCLEQAPKLTAGIKKMGVGPYVRKAFVEARKGNPDATLLINDYRTDEGYVYRVINELVDDDGEKLYDVIGIQSHMHGGYWGAKRTWDVCEKFARFNVPIHFTETTIVSGPKTDKGWETTEADEKRQAEQAVEFYTVLFSHPKVKAITWWDFSDQGAWQGAPAGFLRKDMTPKPMYHALKELVKGKWWTVVDKKCKSGGRVSFRGFCGDYKVTVLSNGRELSRKFSVSRAYSGERNLKLR